MGAGHNCFHFIDEITEAQRGLATPPRPHGYLSGWLSGRARTSGALSRALPRYGDSHLDKKYLQEPGVQSWVGISVPRVSLTGSQRPALGLLTLFSAGLSTQPQGHRGQSPEGQLLAAPREAGEAVADPHSNPLLPLKS